MNSTRFRQPASSVSERSAPSTRIISDEDIWRSFQSGEDAAFNMLYGRYSDRLYAYLKLLLGGTTERLQLDDLFQETWIIVFKERERFSVSANGSFVGWLFRVAHNLAISVLRRTKHTTSIDDLSFDSEFFAGYNTGPVQEEFDRLTTDDLMVHVVNTVEELPLMLREVFALSEFDHLSLEEISEILGITKTNAKVRLFRARKAIRERLTKVLEISL